jgi:hypothetical protein
MAISPWKNGSHQANGQSAVAGSKKEEWAKSV